MNKRFDEDITEKSQAFSTELLAQHKELRGVTIVFDWDFSGSMASELPKGVWTPSEGEVTPLGTHSMCIQLLDMTKFVVKKSLHATDAVLRSVTVSHQEEDVIDGERKELRNTADGSTPSTGGTG